MILIVGRALYLLCNAVLLPVILVFVHYLVVECEDVQIPCTSLCYTMETLLHSPWTYVSYVSCLYFSLGHVYFDAWFFRVVQDPLRYLGRGKPLLSRILKKLVFQILLKTKLPGFARQYSLLYYIDTCLGYSIIIGVRYIFAYANQLAQ